ncbi:hypothetical protein CYLTODRAFT_415771 [Cylindrobasidium torrendii FP15055 ss-10]|uniref:Uncharacterized protein n=1 Tax=Cylindrobasidium torrendii FP15055 ss-10 TaxID=1314674 RepID=A0A0D7AT13_9AGAR|nr:hypothetical protein CYLTODRAFT_415771 [Cylindrobasidium torrendii FP15055 ss-10]
MPPGGKAIGVLALTCHASSSCSTSFRHLQATEHRYARCYHENTPAPAREIRDNNCLVAGFWPPLALIWPRATTLDFWHNSQAYWIKTKRLTFPEPSSFPFPTCYCPNVDGRAPSVAAAKVTARKIRALSWMFIQDSPVRPQPVILLAVALISHSTAAFSVAHRSRQFNDYHATAKRVLMEYAPSIVVHFTLPAVRAFIFYTDLATACAAISCPEKLIKNLGEDAEDRQIQLQWHLPHSRLGPWSLATTARCHPAALVPVPVGPSSTTAQPASNLTTETPNVPVEPSASNVTSRKAQKASLTSFPWKKNPPPEVYSSPPSFPPDQSSHPFQTIVTPSALIPETRNTFAGADEESVSNLTDNQRSNPLPQQISRQAEPSRSNMPHSSMDTAATMTASHICAAPPQLAPMIGVPAHRPEDHNAMPAVPRLSSDPSIPRRTSLTHLSTFPIPYPDLPPDYTAETPSSLQTFDISRSAHGSVFHDGPQGGAYSTANGPVMASPSTSPDTLVGSPSPTLGPSPTLDIQPAQLGKRRAEPTIEDDQPYKRQRGGPQMYDLDSVGMAPWETSLDGMAFDGPGRSPNRPAHHDVENNTANGRLSYF